MKAVRAAAAPREAMPRTDRRGQLDTVGLRRAPLHHQRVGAGAVRRCRQSRQVGDDEPLFALARRQLQVALQQARGREAIGLAHLHVADAVAHHGAVAAQVVAEELPVLARQRPERDRARVAERSVLGPARQRPRLHQLAAAQRRHRPVRTVVGRATQPQPAVGPRRRDAQQFGVEGDRTAVGPHDERFRGRAALTTRLERRGQAGPVLHRIGFLGEEEGREGRDGSDDRETHAKCDLTDRGARGRGRLSRLRKESQRDAAAGEGGADFHASSASAAFATPAVTQKRSASSTDIDETRTLVRGTRMVKPPSW